MPKSSLSPAVRIVNLAPRSEVFARLFVFAHAGGNVSAFREWAGDLPDSIEVLAIALPGRAAMLDQPVINNWEVLLQHTMVALEPYLDGTPYVLFGHSFGALLAYQVVLAIGQREWPKPMSLFVSSHGAPQLQAARQQRVASTHTLPDAEFLAAAQNWGYLDHTLLDNAELVQIMLPALRADLQLDETYQFNVLHANIDIPLVIYGGRDDKSVSLAELSAWQALCSSATVPVTLKLFDGGHFYTNDQRTQLLADMSTTIQHQLRDLPRSIASTLTPSAPPSTQSNLLIQQRFLQQARLSPQALAIVDGDQVLSYQELDWHSQLLAQQMQQDGIKPGDIVGVLLPHCAQYVIAMLATLRAGAAICLLESNWSPSFLSEFAHQAGIVAIVSNQALTQQYQGVFESGQIRCYQANPELGALAGQIARGEFSLPDTNWNEVACSEDDIAMVSMTSGSSGQPKAVLTTHRGCTFCFNARFDLYPYQDGEREACNVFFAWECLRPLLQGMPLYIIPDSIIFDPPRLTRFLETHAITRLTSTPSLLEQVLDHPSARLSRRIGKLRYWFMTGEVVHRRLQEKAAQQFPVTAQLVNMYSTWEALDVSYANLLQQQDGVLKARLSSPAAILGSAGTIIAGVDLYVLDPHLQAVAQGVSGMVYVAGPGLAQGYLNDEQKTAARFVVRPPHLRQAQPGVAGELMYFTGDRGRIHADGQIELLGRDDATVKLRGFKVALHQVEHAIAQIDGVSTCAVLSVPDPRDGQPSALAAYIVGTDGLPADESLATMREAARQLLPQYAVPTYWIGMAEMPMRSGESRKLDARALPAPQARHTLGKAPAQPQIVTGKTGQTISQVWKKHLNLQHIALQDNFFDLGGNSLLAAALAAELSSVYGLSVSVIDLYQHTTLAALIAHCGGSEQGSAPRLPQSPGLLRKTNNQGSTTGHIALAIVGMDCRMPGAANLAQFWDNLQKGKDSLRSLQREALLARGVPASVLDHPDWVAAGQIVDDADKFDAYFWGIAAQEASLMDPQQRMFLEVAWGAMEHAGYAPRSNAYHERTGVFAACGIDGYLVHHLDGGGMKTPLDPARLMLTEIGNEKDYIATRVAYQLDLGGPAMTINSACSSALVAVAQAAQSLRTGECDMAIAGGASLTFPNFGFCYAEGLVGSKDGRVRPFDNDASGTLFGDGIGAIVLKRLDDAQADGDTIWAILSGSAVSNDGRQKAGYAAPNPAAQRNAIVAAMDMAQVQSQQISYVECHATATHVGDAIELQGLSEAFELRKGENADLGGMIAIGSVKGNIGHANCAAGISGLIKTVLALKYQTLVPTAHFQRINPKLHPYVGGKQPFYIHQGCGPWQVRDPVQQLPRRAGVSSFGIGGTNAHVILQQWEAGQPAMVVGQPRNWHLLTLSAKTETALQQAAYQLQQHLAHASPDLANTAYTLHLGREAFACRLALPVNGQQHAIEALRQWRQQMDQGTLPVRCKNPSASVVFCFTGQGSQYAGMARQLYQSAEVPEFTRQFDQVSALFLPHLGWDLRAALWDDTDQATNPDQARPCLVQAGLFALEYALARTVMDYGIVPVALAGHSIGEYVAAVIAGVLSLEDAVQLVALRASATELLVGEAAGGMLGVQLSADDARELIAGRENLWIGVANAPDMSVISGSSTALDEIERELKAQSVRCSRLHVSHAFHSGLMQSVAQKLDQCMAGIKLNAPTIPLTSNVSGGWLDESMLTPDYWGQHMTGTVRWRENVAVLLRWQPDVVLEIGPGTTLCNLVEKGRRAMQQQGLLDPEWQPARISLVSAATSRDANDVEVLLQGLAQCWRAGVVFNWNAYYRDHGNQQGQALQRIPLPGYCFEKTSFWVAPKKSIYVALPVPPAQAAVANAALVGTGLDASHNIDSTMLVRYGTAPDPASITLLCCHFAGGSSRNFEKWSRLAPSWLDVLAIDMPGRNGRIDEPQPADDAADARQLQALALAIRRDLGQRKLVLCGMSYGALLACELALGPLNDLVSSGQLLALHLVGRAWLVPDPDAAPIDTSDYIVASPELRNSDAWKSHFLPLLQADLEADGRAQKRLQKQLIAATPQSVTVLAALPLPLHLHCGADDVSFTPAQAPKWHALSSVAPGTVQAYPGGHEFMLQQGSDIAFRIVESLLPQAQRIQPGSPVVNLAGMQHPGVYANSWRRLPMPAQAATRPDEIQLWQLDRKKMPLTQQQLAQFSAASGLWLLLTGPGYFDSGHEVEQWMALLDLLQQCTRAGVAGKLVLLAPATTQGAFSIGAIKALGYEMPELSSQRVVLDPALYKQLLHAGRPGTLSWWPALANRILQADERDLWCRVEGEQVSVLAQRLQALAHVPDSKPVAAWSDGLIVISGGSGALAQVLVNWLIDEKCVPPRQIVLLARKSFQPARAVRVIVADITVGLDQHQELAALENVTGIFHLAGALDDGLALNMSLERLQQVLRPKAGLLHLMDWARQRAWNLHWIVAFSSTSGLFGYPGQSNYAGANNVLDHAALWAREGLPLVSINWGPWGETGMSKQGTRAYEKSLAGGDVPFSNRAALAALSQILSALRDDFIHPGFHFTVSQTNWPQSIWHAHPALPQAGDMAEDEGSGNRHSSNPIAAMPAIADQTRTHAAGASSESAQPDQASRVRVFLSPFLSRWSEQDDLMTLGLDSLDLVQIRNGFNQTFQAQVPLSLFVTPNLTLGQLEQKLLSLIH